MFQISFCVYLLLIISNVCSANKSCSKDHKECKTQAKNNYSKDVNTKYQKYYNYIQKAKEAYTPCPSPNCGCYADVIARDLKVFKTKGIDEKLIQSIATKGTKYQIIHNKLYREKNCMFPARCAGVEHFLLELLPKKLPDMEFILNTRDWPQIHKQYGPFGPVFSFSKTQDYHDIMYPAWAFWEGGPAISLYPKGIGRWDTHRLKLAQLANDTYQWENKEPKAFFRGSRTSSERDALVLLSREKPELVDAQYTKNQAWKSDADTLHAPPAAEVSFEDHCKFKYLFNFRGVAASFRFKHALLCKSVVFHVGDEWLEFFYAGLKPWVHYIPVNADAGKAQIKELIEFALDNDEIVREIAENGFSMIWNNLQMNDVSCYWSKLLKQYAKILNYKPKLDKSLIQIKAD